MTLYHEQSPGVFVQWVGQPIDSILHPLSIETLWTDEELAEHNLYKPSVPPVPSGKTVSSITAERIAGVVTLVYTFAAFDLEQYRAEKIQAVKDAGDAILEQGYPYDFGEGYGVLHLQLRPGTDDRTNWLGVQAGATMAILGGMGNANGGPIRTAENINVVMPYQQITTMLMGMLSWAQTTAVLSWIKQDQVRNALTKEEIDAVDLTNWDAPQG